MTSDELRTQITEGRAVLRDAIQAAATNWERAASAGEGEQAWSARQTAEHAIGAEVFFTSTVCTDCGYPGLERPETSYASADEALTAFAEVSALCEGRLKYVTESDLEMPDERWETVAGVMAYNATHLQEHAAQIQAAAGGA